jgi:Kef-type K+ transport system membrane component KefB
VFELVAAARSEETFIALCLLSVTGASLLTQRLGFSDTLGAFVAGVLLSGGQPQDGHGLCWAP